MNIRRALGGLLLLGTATGAAAITGDDFLYGQSQYEQLLADRPELGRILVEDDPLRTWVIARFAGAAAGFRIAWDGRPPADGIDAQHQLDPPAVRVHPIHQSGPLRGSPKGAHDLWADVVFELHNAARAPHFVDAWQRVQAGELGYAGWLEAVTRLEHRALLLSRSFYRTRWRIWMRRRGVTPLGFRWAQFLEVPISYAEWIIRYRRSQDYPYTDYGRAFREVESALRPYGGDWSVNPFEYRLIQPGDAVRSGDAVRGEE